MSTGINQLWFHMGYTIFFVVTLCFFTPINFPFDPYDYWGARVTVIVIVLAGLQILRVILFKADAYSWLSSLIALMGLVCVLYIDLAVAVSSKVQFGNGIPGLSRQWNQICGKLAAGVWGLIFAFGIVQFLVQAARVRTNRSTENLQG